MDSEPKNDDLLLLNALVDGELAPADCAALAARLSSERDLARAYAALAQLKASIGESASTLPAGMPAFSLSPKKPLVWPRVTAAATAIAAMLALAFLVLQDLPFDSDPAAPAEGPTAITLASLPAGTSVPRLDTAGLKLVGLAIEPGNVPLFTATYRGPHGCRLDLRAWPSGAVAPVLIGTDRHTWTSGDLVYELVAHGMPKSRFAIIAGAAELQTRAGSDHDRIDRRLREAYVGAPPCLG
jgi:anti-sigma factor RsiW